MPNVEVNCSVSNCVFHTKGNVCGAEKIRIDLDHDSTNKQNTEFASDFDLHSMTKKAQQSSNTCCKTFAPKGKKSK